MKALAVCLLAGIPVFAQPHIHEETIEAARRGPAAPGLRERIARSLSGPQGAIVWGQDFLFVATSPSPVTVSINGQPPLPMVPAA